jgi:hypothetical protein
MSNPIGIAEAAFKASDTTASIDEAMEPGRAMWKDVAGNQMMTTRGLRAWEKAK